MTGWWIRSTMIVPLTPFPGTENYGNGFGTCNVRKINGNKWEQSRISQCIYKIKFDLIGKTETKINWNGDILRCAVCSVSARVKENEGGKEAFLNDMCDSAVVGLSYSLQGSISGLLLLYIVLPNGTTKK